MNARLASIAVAALTIGAAVGCSSDTAAQQAPGTLPAGTARVSIDGTELPLSRAVECAPPEQSFTTITTGNEAAGATMMISNAGKLTVEFVRIRNLNGFSGDYNRGLGNDATVSLTATTYQVAGAAVGYGAKSPAPTTAPFTIMVSC